MKKITFLFAILCSMSAFSMRYLVQTGAEGAATWRAAGAGETVVTLGSIPQRFNDWYTANVAENDEVWVAAGNYALSAPITVTVNNHSVYGGFTGTEIVLTDRIKLSGGNLWDFSNETIINGDNTVQLLFSSAARVNVIFDGLTLTNGNATNAAAQYRDGITIQNCKITNNISSGNGGGVNFYNGGSVINSYIAGNVASSGGGVYSNNASTSVTANISGCLIENNQGTTTAGGVRVQGAGMTEVVNCIIRGNKGISGTALKPGGAIYTNSANNNFINCLVVNNSGTNTIYFNGGNLLSSTIANNVGQVYIASASAAITIINGLIWGNKTSAEGTTNTGITSNTGNTNVQIQYCGVSPALPDGWTQEANFTLEYGNDSQDNNKGPGFILPTTFWGAPADGNQQTELEASKWNYKNTSGALEMGTTLTSVPTDILGVSRPKGVKYDIGAYEFNGIWSALQPAHSTHISYIPTSNGIQVQNLKAGSSVIVYNAAGVTVAREISTGENLNFSLNKGIYILQTNGKTQKISIN